jgi:hypothetical protein
MIDRAGITSTSNTSHEEMKQTTLKRDEEQVQALVNHLNETMPTERALLPKFLHFFSPSLTADSKESCTSLVACMPVEIFMRQVVWASISKGSVMVSVQ